MKELTTRITVAVFGIPLLVFCIWQGDYFFFAAIVVMSVLGQYELYDLMREKELYPQTWPGLLLTILLLYMTAFGAAHYLIAVALVLVLLITGAEMFRNRGSALLNTAGTLFGIVYPGFFLGTDRKSVV